MDFVDTKYISLLSPQLQKFKRVKTDLYNFRCPLCGDSQKNKNKARGYLYAVKNNTNFKCHNCGSSTSFNNLLKSIDPDLHQKYTLEKFKEGHTGKNFVVEEPKLEFSKPVFKKKINLPKASEVEVSKKYLENRLIDSTKFFFVENFKEWTNTQKQTFENVSKDESRIVIPLYTEDGNLFGFQGRSLGKSKVKYITIILDETIPKVYGLNNINKNEVVYVTEGPFDSTFLNNAIAMCGADVNLNSLNFSKVVYILDNEPRNKEICDRLSKLIDKGEQVVIWPKSVKEKDINDMVIAGLNVNDMVKSNTYQGLEAKVKFTEWKKV
jgi:transcription elongation factor Elf1